MTKLVESEEFHNFMTMAFLPLPFIRVLSEVWFVNKFLKTHIRNTCFILS